jgi:hypothetical protein
MTTFDEREEAFEKKFAHEEELKFKAEARRNRLLGQWAAEKLGLGGDEATGYARTIVETALSGGDVLAKVSGDLAGAGIAQAQIRARMDALFEDVLAQLKREG